MTDWRSQAACRGRPDLDWVLNPVDECKQVCRACPVQLPCLDYGLTHPVHGIYGGTMIRNHDPFALGLHRHADGGRRGIRYEQQADDALLADLIASGLVRKVTDR